MVTHVTIRNWIKYQHYKDRRPPWIKLHAELLDNREWRELRDQDKAALLASWMLASRLHDATDTDAELPNDPAYLSALTGCKFTHKTMKSLIDKGFYEPCKHDASTTLAKCYPETETYTKEKETTLSGKPDDAREVLNFLNEKTGLHFRDVPTNMKLIQARLKEGATVQDCRAVIAIQRRQWKDDDKMRDYLRPATLFNATKFWQYHGKVGQANEVPRVQNANDARTGEMSRMRVAEG